MCHHWIYPRVIRGTFHFPFVGTVLCLLPLLVQVLLPRGEGLNQYCLCDGGGCGCGKYKFNLIGESCS